MRLKRRRVVCPYRMRMARKFPLLPANPQRVCWGCDRYCPADDMACGNGSVRTQHPVELLGEDWYVEFDLPKDVTS